MILKNDSVRLYGEIKRWSLFGFKGLKFNLREKRIYKYTNLQTECSWGKLNCIVLKRCTEPVSHHWSKHDTVRERRRVPIVSEEEFPTKDQYQQVAYRLSAAKTTTKVINDQSEEKNNTFESQWWTQSKTTKLHEARENRGRPIRDWFQFCIWLVEKVARVFWTNHRTK